MSGKGISMSGPMVLALKAQRKSQTRRVVNPQPEAFSEGPRVHQKRHDEPYIDAYNGGPTWCWWTTDNRQGPGSSRCPFGIPGERLWVRENHRAVAIYGGLDRQNGERIDGECVEIRYLADGVRRIVPLPERIKRPACHARNALRPSFFMPREWSRFELTIRDVRVQRLQDITDADAVAESFKSRDDFAAYIDALNAKRGYGWSDNYWVWALTFDVHALQPGFAA